MEEGGGKIGFAAGERLCRAHRIGATFGG